MGLTVLGIRLDGGGVASASQGALCYHRVSQGGQLDRRNGGRKRKGREVMRGADRDRAVGADDGLDAGHWVDRPERGHTVRGRHGDGAGDEEDDGRDDDK